MQLEEVKYYHRNGKLCAHYFLDKQERTQGKYIEYYDNSSISFEANFKDGKYHGKYIDYNSDGKINYIIYHWYDKEITKAEYLKLKYDEAMKCS